MADNDDSAQLPYQHLAVLGVEKLKKYVPPANGSASRASVPRLDAPASSGSTSSDNGRE
jgi:hypothetical protein